MVQKIAWTARALKDLRDVYDYIAKDSERYAQIQIDNIQNAVSTLTGFPLIGHIVPEFSHLPYREILVGNYRIIYKFEGDPGQVIIMSVVHGRRLLKGLSD